MFSYSSALQMCPIATPAKHLISAVCFFLITPSPFLSATEICEEEGACLAVKMLVFS